MNKQSEKQCERPQNRHLKPCKKGETHNPKGYPKVLRERDEFRRLCNEMWESGPKDIVTALQEGVRRRKFDCIKEAGERFFGKVPSKNEVSGAGGGPVSISFSVISDETQAKIAEVKKKLNILPQ